MQEQYNVLPAGLGLGMDFSSVLIILEIQTPMNLDSLRRTVLGCYKIANEELNSAEELKPFLEKPAFHANVDLFVKNEDGSKTYDPQICFIGVSKNGVRCKTNDPKDEFKYKNIFEEPIEEALAKNEAYLLRQESN